MTDTSSTGRALPDPAAEPTITVERAAAILGISKRTLYNVIEAGEFAAIRVGRRIVVPTAKFLAAYGLSDKQP